jgi:phosphoadenosine phosphosulfate reductase
MGGRTEHAQRRAEALAYRYGHLSGAALLRPLIEREFPCRIALVSSFGTESAVLLHLAASVDRALPVIFVDTGKHFGETLRYRDALAARLGLEDFRVVGPAPADIIGRDADGVLWHDDPDACCRLRKVEPLAAALAGFDAWISGRKRYQGGARTALPLFEAADGRVKINPLAPWSAADIEAAFAAHDLPRHPLEADGFLSVGCMPCTMRAPSRDDKRSGRWAGTGKTECGIHLGLKRTSP